jgi:hypothetical protein
MVPVPVRVVEPSVTLSVKVSFSSSVPSSVVLMVMGSDRGDVGPAAVKSTVPVVAVKSFGAVGFVTPGVTVHVSSAAASGVSPVWTTVNVTGEPSVADAVLAWRVRTSFAAAAGDAIMTAGTRPITPATAADRIVRIDLGPRSMNGTEPLLAAWAGE